MCHTVRCRKCNKTTWAGCGRHVDQAMARVPRADRCAGHPREESPSFLSRIMGRRR